MVKQYCLGLVFCALWLTGCASSKIHQPIADLPVEPGQIGPIAADNPLQYPFSCTTEQAGLGKPLVDNQDSQGQPVYGRWLFFDYIKGYSQYCGAKTEVGYFYRDQEGHFQPLRLGDVLPDDAEIITDGEERYPFVVRYERGVINRFIYGITVLSDWPVADTTDIASRWNQRLLMLFNGGIGIGHHQAGRVSLKMLGKDAEKSDRLISIFNPDMLRRGYAVAGSTGMGSDTTFNLPLMLQTAEMVKAQAVSIIGEPEFTLGFGASGGSIQQFFNARKNPELLDGVIVSHMFPDLITQINGVGDCELLQYYFDRNHSRENLPKDYWRSWVNRGRIEGFNALNGVDSSFSIDGTGVPLMADAERGSSTCIDGWRGITPLFFNPKLYLPFVDMHQVWLKDRSQVLQQTRWTHWDDAAENYGRDAAGFALRTYDNIGVQYGLQALRAGAISVDTFLDLNARIGSWKAPAQMTYEYAPFYPYGAIAFERIGLTEFVSGNIKLRGLVPFWRGTQNLLTLFPDKQVPSWVKSTLGRDDKQSVWSHQNATSTQGGINNIAPRAEASSEALKNAYQAGMVFQGQWNKPTIALLTYLDDQLDIHDARQPFIFRQRMQQAGSDLSRFNIWGLTRSDQADQDKQQLNLIAMQAIDSMSKWLAQGQKPAEATDRCWDRDYQLIATGNQVWQGIEKADKQLSSKQRSPKQGACVEHFPLHGNPRTAAGGPFTSEILKCDLQPVSEAIAQGVYGGIRFTAQQRQYLEHIFAQGVCAY